MEDAMEDSESEYVPSDESVTDDELDLMETAWKEKKSLYYRKDADYWQSKPGNNNSMTGGDEALNQADIEESILLLNDYLGNGLKCIRALDLGSGIGRVAKNVLLQNRRINIVDCVERDAKFLNQCKESLSELNPHGRYEQNDLYLWKPNGKVSYGLVWIQWVAMFLRDDDLIDLLLRCKEVLTDDGMIVLKESVGTKMVFYPEDNSVTRTHEGHLELFQKTGLKLIESRAQLKFPKEYYSVKMYVLVKG